ncbi:hypothetical protein MAR_016024 [Mya arenaria]|uniref:Uncharacterized protein n=1 Tax=Mya arenaria TaxID=6604 RepID=A0ABY7FIX8_MYAAR|nr:hypothetical protein MAR_016024 [Mya arenaria]
MPVMEEGIDSQTDQYVPTKESYMDNYQNCMKKEISSSYVAQSDTLQIEAAELKLEILRLAQKRTALLWF